jgi:hypothetical protein
LPAARADALRSNGLFVREVAMSAFDFNAAQHYTSVSMQQGRVQLDADSHEDSEANSEKIRRLTAETAVAVAESAPQSAATMQSALAGLEPTGGLHPLAHDWVSRWPRDAP